MQKSGPILIQNIRRVALFMGLALFVVFAYRATSEVSSSSVAAGNRRQQTLVAFSPLGTTLNIAGLTDEHASKVVSNVTAVNASSVGTTQNSKSELSQSNRLERPVHSAKVKHENKITSDSLKTKSKEK